MTSAPKSASCEETALPATRRERSTTRTPSSGAAASGANDFLGRSIGSFLLGASQRTLQAATGKENQAPPWATGRCNNEGAIPPARAFFWRQSVRGAASGLSEDYR